MKVFLKKVRLSYPNLFEARSYEGSDPKFGAAFLMKPDSDNVKAIEDAMKAVATEKWASKGAAQLAALKASQRVCMRSGDEKASDGYEGMVFTNTSSAKRPQVVDTDGVTPLTAGDGRPYGGCYVNAWIDVWAMENKFGKRICASLSSVQFHSHGEPFSGAGGAPDAFSAVEDDEEDLV